MIEQMGLVIVRQKSIVRAALVTGGVLLIPLWGTFYVDGWNWGWPAFVRVGAFVFSAALTYQLVVKGMTTRHPDSPWGLRSRPLSFSPGRTSSSPLM